MENFISLLKKELLGEISKTEKAALLELTKSNPDLDDIYRVLCLPKHGGLNEEEIKEAIGAYERHQEKLKKKNVL
jgi:hypothetical protein